MKMGKEKRSKKSKKKSKKKDARRTRARASLIMLSAFAVDALWRSCRSKLSTLLKADVRREKKERGGGGFDDDSDEDDESGVAAGGYLEALVLRALESLAALGVHPRDGGNVPRLRGGGQNLLLYEFLRQ